MQLGIPVNLRTTNTPGPLPHCPLCQQNDRVEKASAIYIEGLSSQKRLKQAGEGDDVKRITHLAPQEVRFLSSRLAPPAAPTRIQVRPVNPDLVVVVFTAVLPVFLIGIANSQRSQLFPILGLVALAYLAYFLSRSRILKRFASQQAERQAEAQRIEKAIQNWMKLYYCARDEILFYPRSPRTASVEEIHSLLFPDSPST